MPIKTQLITLMVIITTLLLAHFSSIYCDFLFYDDLERYSEAIHNRLVLGVRFKRTLVMPFINWPMTKIMSINIPAARTIVVLFMVPIVVALFWFCNIRLRFSWSSALILSIAPLIVPGITIVPLMIVGSYGIYGILTFFLSIYCAKLYLDTNKYQYLFFQAIAYLLAIEITESSIPILIPAIFILYFVRSKVGIKSFLLVSSIFIISAASKIIRVLLFPIGSTTVTSLSAETILERLKTFFSWGVPYWGIENSPHLGLILSGLTGISLLFVIYLFATVKQPYKLFCKRFSQFSQNELFLILTIGAFVWSVVSFLPFTVSKYFSNRYGLIGALGISWLYLLPVIYFIEKYIKTKELKIFIAICMLMISVIQNNLTFRKQFLTGEMMTKGIREVLKKFQFPSDSQIVLIGSALTPLKTGNYWVWSTGFLQRITERKDITGIVGHEYKKYDPFAKNSKGYSFHMQGLNRTKPAFVFRVHNEKLLPMKYGVQWISEKKWSLLSFDLSSGEIKNVTSGSDNHELRSTITGLSAKVAWSGIN